MLYKKLCKYLKFYLILNLLTFSRLLSQLDLLEKYVANRSSFKTKEEELLLFRNATGKILSQLEGPGKKY